MASDPQTESMLDEALFLKFVDALPIGIFLLDAEGKPVHANEAATDILGKGLVPGTRLDDLSETYRAYRADTMTEYPTEDLPIVRALRGEKVQVDDMVLFRPDGVVPIRVWAAPVYDNEGRLLYAMAAFQDVETEAKARDQLAEQARSLDSFSRQLDQLHRLNSCRFDSHEELLDEYLAAGLDVFSMATGIVSRIEGTRYELLRVRSDRDDLEKGGVFELENTYCNAVIQTRKTVAYSHVGRIRSMLSHPVYQSMKLEAYISTPIMVHGEVYGTLNFSSTTPRPHSFERHDFELIELMADNIGRYIEIDALRKRHDRLEAELAEALKKLKAREA